MEKGANSLLDADESSFFESHSFRCSAVAFFTRLGLIIAALTATSAPAQGQIPDGWEIVEIFPAGTEFFCGPPDINDRGQIAFGRRLWPSDLDSEIFLYDRGNLVQLTNDDIYDAFPRLNNHREIVWVRDVKGNGQDSGIVSWNQGRLIVVADEPYSEYSPDTNDAGQIVWVGALNPSQNRDALFLADENRTYQLTNSQFSNQSPRMNQDGDVVFTEYDFRMGPWESRVFAYFEPFLRRLSQGQPQPQFPDINDHGQVVWQGLITGIELWESGKTVQLVADNAFGARINNRRQVCFQRWEPVPRNFGLWLIDDGQPLQLTSGAYGGLGQAINNRGEIVFMHGRHPAFGIALFTKPSFRADFDLDRDVDLRDAALFHNCFGLAECTDGEGCWATDANNDAQVDLIDFEFLASFIEGPVHERQRR